MYNQGRGAGPSQWPASHTGPVAAGLPPRPASSSQTALAAPGYAHIHQTPNYNSYNSSGAYSSSYYRPSAAQNILVNPYAPTQFSQALPSNNSLYPHNGIHNNASSSSTSQFRSPQSRGAFPCSRQGCSYTGVSRQDTETHMMDRHFIYPPGYNSRKRKREEGGGPDGDLSR